jgi:hypothetical protein
LNVSKSWREKESESERETERKKEREREKESEKERERERERKKEKSEREREFLESFDTTRHLIIFHLNYIINDANFKFFVSQLFSLPLTIETKKKARG